MRINWPLISILPLDSCSPIRPALKGHSPPAVTTKMTDIDLGIDDGVIWAANFNTDIRFDVPLPALPADVKSNDIIKTSDPNNPKIDTHNDTIVISFEF